MRAKSPPPFLAREKSQGGGGLIMKATVIKNPTSEPHCNQNEHQIPF